MNKKLSDGLLVRPFPFAVDKAGSHSALNGRVCTISTHAYVITKLSVGPWPSIHQDLQGY
jgi:hypothetical protein